MSALAYNRGFVSIHDGQFWVGNKPFVYAGTNTYYLIVYSAILPGEGSLGPYVHEVMGKARAMGLTVVRTWAFNDGASQWHALQTAPGVYDEYVFQGLDYVIHRADMLNLRLILTLVNNWDDYGGMNQYVAWSPTASVHDDFYTDANCRQYFKNHIAAVLNRYNTLTGRYYKDEPTIMAWQLANEPHCGSAGALDAWIAEMSAHVRSLDPDHLITTGIEGITWGGQNFVQNHSHATVDFATLHLWPDWWGWSLSTCNNFLIERLDEADRTLMRPMILQEFGKVRPLSTRDGFYSQFYSTLNMYNAAGSNFWMLAHDDYAIYDDGFFVLYPADSSTISIIEQQAAESRNRSQLVDAYADKVYSVVAGSGAGGEPAAALGPPDGRVYSLGRGGSMIVRFTDNLLVDGPGHDLVVYEDSILHGASGVNEYAAVSVSTDGVSFTPLDIAYGTTAFDIGAAGLNATAYAYVKIEDDGDYGGEGDPQAEGYDLNAVRCLHTRRTDYSKVIRVNAGADVVVSASGGTGAGRNDRRNVLGLPGGPGWSLGTGGSITLKFTNNDIVDRDGADFIVYEGTLKPDDAGIAEAAYVFVSLDGTSFSPVGMAVGTTAFDLGGSGLSRARYVRVVDDGGGADDNSAGNSGGYDLNAVCALHYVSTLSGDVNKDGVVDLLDVVVLSGSYGATSGSPRYDPDADLNIDGVVDLRDVAIISGCYGNILEDFSHADINGDGCVNGADVSIFNEAYGAMVTDPHYNAACDLNEDGIVDILDADILTSQLGTCPGL